MTYNFLLFSQRFFLGLLPKVAGLVAKLQQDYLSHSGQCQDYIIFYVKMAACCKWNRLKVER